MKKLPLICAASLALVLSACTNNIKEKMSYAENKENKISSKNLPFYFFENSPKLREDGNPLVDLYTLENNQPKKIASNLDSNDDGFRVTNSMESSYYYIDNKKKLFKISAENNTPELIDSNVDWIYYDDDKEEDKMMGVSYIKEDYMYFSIKDKIIKTAHLDIEYDDSEAELELEIQNEDDYFIEPINHTFYYQDENGEGRKLDLLTGDEDSFDRSLLEGYTKSEHIHTENENSLQTDDALSLMKEARQETFIPGSAQSFFECNGEVYIYEETDIESGVGILYNYSDDYHTIDENVEGNSIEITKNAVFYKTQIDNKSSNYYQYNEDEDGEEAIQSTVGDNLEDFNDTNIYITQSEFEVNGEVETYIDGEQEEPSFEASKVFSKIGDDYVYTFGKTDIEGTTQDLYVGRKKIASNVTEVKAKNNKISTQ